MPRRRTTSTGSRLARATSRCTAPRPSGSKSRSSRSTIGANGVTRSTTSRTRRPAWEARAAAPLEKPTERPQIVRQLRSRARRLSAPAALRDSEPGQIREEAALRIPRRCRGFRAHSSAGERSLHTREVRGSIPRAPTTDLQGFLGSAALDPRVPPNAYPTAGSRRASERRDFGAIRHGSAGHAAAPSSRPTCSCVASIAPSCSSPVAGSRRVARRPEDVLLECERGLLAGALVEVAVAA